MKTWQPWTITNGTLQLTEWPDHGPGAVLDGRTHESEGGEAMDASYYSHWIPEDELPEGYPYNLALDKSVVVDGVRMFPPFNEQNSEPATPGEDES